MALASETSTLDGFAPTTAILDEWHEAKLVKRTTSLSQE